MDELQERLTDLEVRYAFQADLVEELNEVLTECMKRLDHLEGENRRLREMVRSLAPESMESPDE